MSVRSAVVGFTGVAVALLASLSTALAQAPVDLRLGALRGERIEARSGADVGRIAMRADRGAKVRLTGDGGIVFSGHQYSETLATLAPKTEIDPAGFVFQTRFALAQPPGFYGHLLILSPRVGDGPDAPAYRVSYRFVGACPLAWNNTGFYLTNTAGEAYRKDPLSCTPIAGSPYRLVYGRTYIATTAIRDTPAGVSIRFYLHDTTRQGDDEKPLFEFTDADSGRLTGGTLRVQLGSGGLVYPAAPVWFGGIRLLPLAQIDAALRDRTRGPEPAVSDLAAPVPAQGTALPNLFTDGMVLQRGKPIRVWGRGIDGDRVTVRLAGRSAGALVAGGRWRVDLKPLPAGGPHTLTVSSRDRTITVQDVLIGEVWVLGGQSNMGWPLSATTEADTELPRADFPSIRIFGGWHPSADEPQFDLGGGTWKRVSPALNGYYSAVGYYFARALHQKLGVPIGLLDTSTPATGIECWMSAAAAAEVWGPAVSQPVGRFPVGMQDPACYYNGKVAPVMPAGIAGMIWYQGDGSSPETGAAYRRTIPALIRDWRRGFAQGDLPFLVVQIPRFEGCSPEMRESQALAVLGAPKAGLAVTLDTGDAKDIHPRNKRPVGERLALLARALAYGERIEAAGPVYRSMVVKGGRALLTFGHAGRGLRLDGAQGFEVRGATGGYVPARAEVIGKDRLAVWSDAVPQPVAVRYAWAPVPEVSLTNLAGILAGPFRTRPD
jgi:sialate O-acetylesterase